MSDYENMMCAAEAIKDGLDPRFLQVTSLGTKPEPILINIANIAAIRYARDYSETATICGTEIILNHSDAERSQAFRVRESFEDIRRGLARAITIFHPIPAPKPLTERTEEEEA